jgi:hypothetical protein
MKTQLSMHKIYIAFIISFLSVSILNAQTDRWQQAADYKMKIDFDHNKHQYDGNQIIIYTNNSPDTLTHLFYHLYFNAFQPGSMMDVRSRNIADPDRRVGDRISLLSENEIGYQKIKSLKKNDEKLDFKIEGTILEVVLDEPIMPGEKCKLEMDFESQVPLQIRRSGRNNAEGIDYSMTQWYPKLCEYDYQGWHSNPYVGREFYGIWGNFDVEINIDAKYTVAAGAVLLNADDIGKGYTNKDILHKDGSKINWHFRADNVHDFMWAADPDYTHTTYTSVAGPILHFFYQAGEKTTENWSLLPSIMDKSLTYMNKRFGKYPYPVYNFIQGGDGGMEYPMGTLITGERTLNSLVGVSIHEWMHSWYQMIIGTNEALYSWMDEGFTSYGSAETMNYLIEQKIITGKVSENPSQRSLNGIVIFSNGGTAEPLSIHADHYKTNSAYGVNAYTKGETFLKQIEYIIGKKDFNKGIKRYFNEWKFKHPNPNDFIRIMEKTSGLELDWYKEYMINTIQFPDYAIDTLMNKKLLLAKQDGFPMPLDVVVTKKNGESICYYIPITLMRGEKSSDFEVYDHVHIASDWPWTNLNYELAIKENVDDIIKIEIDPTYRYADGNRIDNIWPRAIEQTEVQEDQE